jgi:hypothetical protein
MGFLARPASAEVMGEYRAYLLKEDGHVIHRLDLVCPDDEAAKVRAKQLVDGHDVELWERARHIATFKRRAPRQPV